MLNAVMPIKDKLFRYAYNILGNQMAAEDVVQEVMIKIWKKKEELTGIENKEAWCMTVTRNLALDKKRKVKAYHEPVELHYGLAGKEDSAVVCMERAEIMKAIKKAIAELPQDQQQVIHLRDVEGYSYKEIADITKLTLDKVKVYLHRGRLTLRLKLSTLYHEQQKKRTSY